jgi:hypothetical protein
MYVMFLCFFVIDEGYEIRSNSVCSPYRKQSFETLPEAKHQCIKDPSCTMFFNVGGAVHRASFLCDEGAVIEISTLGAVLFIKKGEYIRISTPFSNASNHIRAKRFS